MDGESDIPISLVAQWVFCPRRAWLEAAGETVDSAQMQSGFAAHKNVDNPATERPEETRALEVRSEELGVVGKLDCVEETEGCFEIVEYKATPVKHRPEVTKAMRLQLALQAICLADAGYDVVGTSIFFTSHHKRVSVELNDDDYRGARAAVEGVREVVYSDEAPLPLEDDPRCSRCSHANICLPEERALAPVRHRIRVADPDSQIAHLATPGAYARCSQGQMIVTKDGETLVKVPLEKIQGLQVHGNVNLSGALIREILWRGRTIVWCSGSGRITGWAVSTFGPNGQQRVEQHVVSHEGRLDLAREFISAKIANQTTQLRRNGLDAALVKEMRVLQARAFDAACTSDLFGYEGDAASIYFANWPLLIKDSFREDWEWHGRSGRPATNPLNALLNYSYSLLLSDIIRSIISCGLDPHAGFLHSSKRNKPALALDLMEEFRAPISDSVVQTVINNGEVKPEGFECVMGSVRMKESVRKSLIAAYERRVETEFKHPVFEYSVTWRRAMEIQARQILGVLDGSQPSYKGIRVR